LCEETNNKPYGREIGKFKQCENVLFKELLKGQPHLLQLKDYLHKNFKGKKGPVRKFRGVLSKSGSKRPLHRQKGVQCM
jgi:hypothetical protein